MGRQIRLSKASALAAGLLDPSLAAKVRPAERMKAADLAKTQAPAAPAEKPKRKRSVSRPALHPKMSEGPAGTGSLEFAPEGHVCAAVFLLDLVPVPKERPRVVTNPKTDKVFGYTPARTKYFTTEVQKVIKSVFRKRPPINGPVRLEMTFVMEIPKSWPKWQKAAAREGLIVPTGRPDMDNLEKALLDAFNECLIVDDAFVVERRARKIYGDVPQIRTRVELTGQLSLNARREAVDLLRKLRQEPSDI